MQFVSPDDVALSHIDYRLTLSDGETWSGTTDAEGRTQRIGSKQKAQIQTAEFFAQRDRLACCAITKDIAPVALKTVQLKDVHTTEQHYGSSVKKVTLDSKSRPLTKGEIDMAWMIFRDAVDYSKVKVHAEPYLWFGLQPKDVAMTPDGEMYFDKAQFKDDFSQESDREKHWFMHEMVHVWQFQRKYPVRIRGAIRIGLDYNYSLAIEKKLADYNMEGQGDLLADYFAVKYLRSAEAMRQKKYQHAQKLYEEVLSDFFKDRKSQSNLPGYNIELDPHVDIP